MIVYTRKSATAEIARDADDVGAGPDPQSQSRADGFRDFSYHRVSSVLNNNNNNNNRTISKAP